MSPPPPQKEKSLDSIGTACLALSALELVYCAEHVVSQLLGALQMKGPLAGWPGMPHAGPAEAQLDRMKDAIGGVMTKLAVWEAVRMIPFLVATSFLLWIAVRLRRGDATALHAARKWTLGAFAAIAVSLAIQLLVTMPMMTDAFGRFFASFPGSSSVFDDPLLHTVMRVGTLVVTAGGALFMSVWPIVLLLWSGRLIERLAPPPA